MNSHQVASIVVFHGGPVYGTTTYLGAFDAASCSLYFRSESSSVAKTVEPSEWRHSASPEGSPISLSRMPLFASTIKTQSRDQGNLLGVFLTRNVSSHRLESLVFDCFANPSHQSDRLEFSEQRRTLRISDWDGKAVSLVLNFDHVEKIAVPIIREPGLVTVSDNRF